MRQDLFGQHREAEVRGEGKEQTANCGVGGGLRLTVGNPKGAAGQVKGARRCRDSAWAS